MQKLYNIHNNPKNFRVVAFIYNIATQQCILYRLQCIEYVENKHVISNPKSNNLININLIKSRKLYSVHIM